MATQTNVTTEEDRPPASTEIIDVQQTTCCIVGAGPAGTMLGLMLARKGVPVLVLEAHNDLDREFRGDSLYPSVLEIMEELGLVDSLLALPHSKITSVSLRSSRAGIGLIALNRLKTPYPYLMMIPQVRFLELIVAEAQRFPNFRLVMRANVQELVEEGKRVCGVRYRGTDGWHEVRALLTVAADGRFSRMRRLAGFEPIKSSPPMDVIWFRLPMESGDPEGQHFWRFGSGQMLAVLNRGDYWQVGYVFPKGSYQQLRTGGVDVLRRSFAQLVPEFSERVDHLQDWNQTSVLTVESSRIRRWYRDGLLLIGDAAHVMGPFGGVGVNYAIQDAVVAANVLSEPLQAGRVRPRHLAAVQRKREWSIRAIQALQNVLHDQIVLATRDPNKRFRMPLLLRLPFLRRLTPRLLAFGLQRVHVKP